MNVGLKYIDFSDNKISDSGGVCLADMLEHTSSFLSINLSNNLLHTEAGKRFFGCCQNNKNIIHINLKYNSIHHKYLYEINKICVANLREMKKKILPKYRQEVENSKIDYNFYNIIRQKEPYILKEQLVLEKLIKEENKNFSNIKEKKLSKYNERQLALEKLFEDHFQIEEKIKEQDTMNLEEQKLMNKEINKIGGKVFNINHEVEILETKG